MTSESKKSVCVYCGHRNGHDPLFVQEAERLGAEIARQGHRLVYGGGTLGLMGAVAKGARDQSGHVMGIIPKHLFDREIHEQPKSEVILTETMHERKKLMVMNSDAFVLLPGGLGSLDEFFELITWRQIGLHDKACFILNTNGLWNGLGGLIETQIEAGFVPEGNRSYFELCDTVETIAQKLRAI